MAMPSKILATMKPLFKKTPAVATKGANKALLEYRQLTIDMAKRSASRKALRSTLGKNKLTALASPEYHQMLKKNIIEYGDEVVKDVSHPVNTLKRQVEMIKHNVDPAGNITKRSPVGTAAMGTALFGLPLYYGGQELNNPDPYTSTGEKVIRAAATTIPAALTPKALPSLLAMSIPDAIYKKKKPTIRRKIEKYISPTDLLAYYDRISSISGI